MVLHHRGRSQYPCRRGRFLPFARLAREHQMADGRREANGTIPRPPLQRRKARTGRRHLGRAQGSRQGPFHLDVLRHALLPHQRSVFQGLLPIRKSYASIETANAPKLMLIDPNRSSRPSASPNSTPTWSRLPHTPWHTPVPARWRGAQASSENRATTSSYQFSSPLSGRPL